MIMLSPRIVGLNFLDNMQILPTRWPACLDLPPLYRAEQPLSQYAAIKNGPPGYIQRRHTLAALNESQRHGARAEQWAAAR